MNKYDVIVIGGGLLGCFAARNLTRYNLKVALLEKREDLCTGISRANTAIVYSGCDTKPGSLKTALCVKASQDFSSLCADLGVRYSQCGSIMISFGPRGDEVLQWKLEQGTKNGVRDMEMLTGAQVLELEPNIAPNVRAGLFIPETGTVMPWEFCLAAAENAAKNGAEIKLNTEVTGVEYEHGWNKNRNRAKTAVKSEENAPGEFSDVSESEYIIKTNNGIFHTKAVVNCAGMSADGILELASTPVVRIIPTAGDYYVLDTKTAGHIKHVIFHEPEEKGKGLTLVPTVEGNILVGPTERSLTSESGGQSAVSRSRSSGNGEWGSEGSITGSEDEGSEASFYETSCEGLEQLRKFVSEVIPTLPMEQVISFFAAVRPNPYMQSQDESGNWVTDGRSVNDLCVIESETGAFISLVGIKTPGLTCSNELGMYVAEKIAARLNAGPNENFTPYRKAPVRAGELSDKQRHELIKANPKYGNIICRCQGISEGEIIDAIRRSPGAVTTDGIKRRTAADSGRCQGGFCIQRTIQILSDELGYSLDEVTKRGGESNILMGNTK